jgi:hypothetical protein
MATETAIPQTAFERPVWWARDFRKECPDEMAMIGEWWNAHGHPFRAFSPALLPPLGLVIEQHGEPIAALWCHLSMGCGVCFLDYPVTRPGLSRATAADAFRRLVNAISIVVRGYDYGMMVANANPACAHWLESNCDFLDGGSTKNMVKLL